MKCTVLVLVLLIAGCSTVPPKPAGHPSSQYANFAQLRPSPIGMAHLVLYATGCADMAYEMYGYPSPSISGHNPSALESRIC
jgi:hypothetical protein